MKKFVRIRKQVLSPKAECEDIVLRFHGMSIDEMAAVMKKLDMKALVTNNPLSEPI